MAEAKRATRLRSRGSLSAAVEEALSTWLCPAVAGLVLAGATLLDALGLVTDPPAALAVVVALLLLGAFAALGPRPPHGDLVRPRPIVRLGVAIAWVGMLTTPFALRLFPGAPIASTLLDPRHVGDRFALGSGRFELIVDAHLPKTSDRTSRELHYALTLTDGAGTSQRYGGDLGDRWQSRRLGRRGTAPVHLEHLSIRHPIESIGGGTLRIDDVAIAGVPQATIAGAFYRQRLPAEIWLLGSGLLLVLGALAFDLRWFPHQASIATLLTASAMGAALVFCTSTTGHPGLRQVVGSTIVGGIGGVPTAGVAAWLARRSSWTRAITCRRAT